MKRAFSSDCLANSSELNLRFTCLSSSPCSEAPWVGKGCRYRAWVAMSPFSRWSHATGSCSALSRGLKVGAQCWVGSFVRAPVTEQRTPLVPPRCRGYKITVLPGTGEQLSDRLPGRAPPLITELCWQRLHSRFSSYFYYK